MATEKQKIMKFKNGPEEGKELEWNSRSIPPPTAHAAVDENTIAVYDRDSIRPLDNRIEYVYALREYMEG